MVHIGQKFSGRVEVMASDELDARRLIKNAITRKSITADSHMESKGIIIKFIEELSIDNENKIYGTQD